MTSTESPVRRAEQSEHGRATQVLAEAFGDDPITTWIVGAGRDTTKRLQHLFGHMLCGELADDDHLVDITDGGNAVALWHAVDRWKTPPVGIVKMAPAAVRTFGRRLPRALQTLSMIECGSSGRTTSTPRVHRCAPA